MMTEVITGPPAEQGSGRCYATSEIIGVTGIAAPMLVRIVRWPVETHG